MQFTKLHKCSEFVTVNSFEKALVQDCQFNCIRGAEHRSGVFADPQSILNFHKYRVMNIGHFIRDMED